MSWDVSRGLVKVNPIASWTEQDVRQYTEERDLPEHPLRGPGLRVDRLLAVHPRRRRGRRRRARAAGPDATSWSAACT